MTARSWIELTQAHTEERIKTDAGSVTLHLCAQAACTTSAVSLKQRARYLFIYCSLLRLYHVVRYESTPRYILYSVKNVELKAQNILTGIFPVFFFCFVLNLFAPCCICPHTPEISFHFQRTRTPSDKHESGFRL